MKTTEITKARRERVKNYLVEQGWPETFFKSDFPALKHMPWELLKSDLASIGYDTIPNPDHPRGWANSRNKIEPKYGRLPAPGETKDNRDHDPTDGETGKVLPGICGVR